MKCTKERYVTWRTFKKHFKRKYLLGQYYEDKGKEVYELRLGSMTIKELYSKFLSLLCYVHHIIDKKTKNTSFSQLYASYVQI